MCVWGLSDIEKNCSPNFYYDFQIYMNELYDILVLEMSMWNGALFNGNWNDSKLNYDWTIVHPETMWYYVYSILNYPYSVKRK